MGGRFVRFHWIPKGQTKVHNRDLFRVSPFSGMLVFVLLCAWKCAYGRFSFTKIPGMIPLIPVHRSAAPFWTNPEQQAPWILRAPRITNHLTNMVARVWVVLCRSCVTPPRDVRQFSHMRSRSTCKRTFTEKFRRRSKKKQEVRPPQR